MPDVAIIGAGIAGASIAYHLRRAGCKDVVLLERESSTGKGATGKSMGGVRAQFSTEPNIRMSLYSLGFFREHAVATGYRAQGYLFVATEETHLAMLARNLTLQHSLGLTEVRALSPAGVRDAAPGLRTDDILGGNFCPIDGFVDPHSTLNFFLGGANVRRRVTVTGVRQSHGRVEGIETSEGFVAAGTVVNAAGVLAAQVSPIPLPITPLRRALVPTEPFDRLSAGLPMIVDLSTGFHFRPEARGFLLAWNDPAETPGFREGVAPGFVEALLEKAADRVPAFAEAQVNPRRAWAGLYDVSPDHHAILGAVPEFQGYFCANGFSGHGVMHSPATGRILADLILHGDTDVVDAAALSPGRFQAGKLVPELAVL